MRKDDLVRWKDRVIEIARNEYVYYFSMMDALCIQSALIEDKLVAAPKKARKLTFTDPFIYHAINQWLYPIDKPYQRIEQCVTDTSISAELVEAIVSNQFRRYYPTYYLKSAGEIDVAYVYNNTFWPIEIKWRNQVRPKDLKLISKYKHARVFSKIYSCSEINDIPIEPLPLALIRSDPE